MRLASIAGLSALVAAFACQTVAAAPRAAGLDAEVHASWTGLPLGEWADRAAEIAGMPVILDRRVDPTGPVSLASRGESLREVLAKVAAAAGAAVDELESSIRIVPAAVAGRAALAERDRRLRLARLPPDLRDALASKAAWTWPAGARPRDLVAAAALEAGVRLEGLDDLPYDHFPAASLPPLSLADRLDLVLAHFDRRVIWSLGPAGPAGVIVAIDADIRPEAEAAIATAGRPRRPTRPPRTTELRDEFTLRLAAPLDQALAAIAGRLGLTLELDAASLAARGIAPGEIVRAEVEKASRTELLDALVRPLGLEWTIAGDRLRVFAPAAASAPK